MTSISGHLLAYEFTGSYHKWYGCHLLSLFDTPVSKQCFDENYHKWYGYHLLSFFDVLVSKHIKQCFNENYAKIKRIYVIDDNCT